MSGGLLTCLDLNISGVDRRPSISASTSTGSLWVRSTIVILVTFPEGECTEWFGVSANTVRSVAEVVEQEADP